MDDKYSFYVTIAPPRRIAFGYAVLLYFRKRRCGHSFKTTVKLCPFRPFGKRKSEIAEATARNSEKTDKTNNLIGLLLCSFP